jgi:aspartyl-tRNA(Asn)/glutamyl-tRNA(Gln) amidotransferase subunit A
VAIAAGYAPVGIGSDTGGSVRIPSAFNGLTGLKVTFGRISLHGTGLLSWTLDSIGPMARNVADCALVLDALAGADHRDPGTLSQPLEQFHRDPRAVRGLRLALPEASQLPAFMDPAFAAGGGRQMFSRWASRWSAPPAGVVLRPLGARRTIIASEAFIHGAYVHDPAVPLGDAVRKRILAARFRPWRLCAELHTMAEQPPDGRLVRNCDAVLLPPPIPIPVAQVEEASPIPGYLTRPANYLGLCALAQPGGLVHGLPASIQIVGKPYAERTVLSLGQAFEAATGFARQRPALDGLGLS